MSVNVCKLVTGSMSDPVTRWLLFLAWLRGVDARPVALIPSQVNDAVTWPIIVLVSVAILLAMVFSVVGCLCCRRNKFTNMFGTVGNGVPATQDAGVAVPASTHEFTMFPPPGGHSRSVDDVRFDPLPDIRPRRRRTSSEATAKPKPATFSNAVNRGISVQDWFDDPCANFPRNRLQYVRQLGSGWFGQVVEGEAQGIVPSRKKVKVVVKILQEDATPTDQMYFLHEARPFRDSDHPNVLKLLGKCLESDPFLVILEHCALKNLKSYLIERRGNAEFETALRENFPLRAVCSVAAGLRYLHSKDFVHTDLASRNCLVAADGTVKIGDYGNSIELFKGDYYCAGGIAVPIRWCAPETLRCTDTIIETREVTKYANIWSFGIVIWEVLEFGKLPYLELSDDEVIKHVIVDNAYRPEPPRVPSPHLDRIYRVSRACLEEIRISIENACDALSSLLSVPDGGDPSADFESRWRRLGSKEGDRSTSSREISPFSWRESASDSMRNLRGSLEEVDPAATVAEDSKEEESLALSLQVNEVIRRFDDMLLMDGAAGDGPESRSQEDLTWKRMLESNIQGSGDLNRLMREKSQSVQDFLKLTVVDTSESGSDSEPQQPLSASEPTLDTKADLEVKAEVPDGGWSTLATTTDTAAGTTTTPSSLHSLRDPGHALDGGQVPPPQRLSLVKWAGDMVETLMRRAMDAKAPEPQVPLNFRFSPKDIDEEEEDRVDEVPSVCFSATVPDDGNIDTHPSPPVDDETDTVMGLVEDSKEYEEEDDEILMVDVETNEAVLIDSPRAAAAKAVQGVPVVVEAPSSPSASSSSLSLLWSASDLAEWGSENSLRHSGASGSWLATVPDTAQSEAPGLFDFTKLDLEEEVVVDPETVISVLGEDPQKMDQDADLSECLVVDLLGEDGEEVAVPEPMSVEASEASSVWWKEEEEKDPRYTPDWESESEVTSSPTSSSSSSGEFVCVKPANNGQFLWKADEVPAEEDEEPPPEENNHEGEEELDEEEEEEEEVEEEFKVSTWDRDATPSKGLLKSPEKRNGEEKKSVTFKAQTRKVIYEYPREEVEEERYVDISSQHPFWMMIDPSFDYNSYADWVLEGEEIPEDMVDVDEQEDGEDLDACGAAGADDYQMPWDRRPLQRTDELTQAHDLYRLGGVPMAEEDDDEETGDYDPSAQARSTEALAFYDSHEAYNLAALLSRYGDAESNGAVSEEDMWLEAILNAGNFYVSGTDSPFDFFPSGADPVDWRGEGNTDLGVSLADEMGEDEEGDEDFVFEGPQQRINGEAELPFPEEEEDFNANGPAVETQDPDRVSPPQDGEADRREWNGTTAEGEKALVRSPGQKVQLECSNARSVESTA